MFFSHRPPLKLSLALWISLEWFIDWWSKFKMHKRELRLSFGQIYMLYNRLYKFLPFCTVDRRHFETWAKQSSRVFKVVDILGIARKSMQQGAGTHIETTELKFWPCTRAPVPCLNFYLGSCKKGVFRLVTRQYCIWASCPVINSGHRLISIMITFTSYYRIDLFIVEQTRAAYT